MRIIFPILVLLNFGYGFYDSFLPNDWKGYLFLLTIFIIIVVVMYGKYQDKKKEDE